MKLITIYLRSLAGTFYTAYTGFFVLVIYFSFGLLRNTEHYTIAVLTVNNLEITGFMLILWSLYGLMTVSYITRTLKKPDFRIFHHSALFPLNNQILFFAVTQFVVNLPVIAYGSFIIGIAYIEYAWPSALIILTFQFMSILLPPLIYMALLKRPYKETRTGLIQRLLQKHITLPWNQWFNLHLIQRKPMLLWLSKLFSLMVLLGVFWLYHTEDYDWRLLGIGLLIGYGGNVIIIYHYYQFYQVQLENFKSFPLSPLRIMTSQVAGIFILLIPELILVVYHYPAPEGLLTLVNLLLFGPSFCWFYLQMIFWRGMTQDDLLQFCFFLLVGLTILILFKMPLLVINLFLILICLIINRYYYQILYSDRLAQA
ncbi:MAG: hypothetical protein ACNS62_13045 [Candidatus Cyclobacteriaceae bacterium M3_2C_046]